MGRRFERLKRGGSVVGPVEGDRRGDVAAYQLYIGCFDGIAAKYKNRCGDSTT